MSLNWIKSSFSASNGNCVEAARDGEWIVVRDSKFPQGFQLRFNRGEWSVFLAGAKTGEFDFTEPGNHE